jgi:thymidylate synthase (FAD)
MNITVELLHVTPLQILVGAIRQCYESQDKSDSGTNYKEICEGWKLGPKDKALIETITKDGHGSTLEHINFNFQIKGISRLNLQELARHRMASYSVKSTRYTLKELKNEEPFIEDIQMT